MFMDGTSIYRKHPPSILCAPATYLLARLLFAPDFGLSKIYPPGTTEDDTYKVQCGFTGCGK